MKRISRNRPLTPEEVAKYKAIRKQVAEELPDLIKRHHERITPQPLAQRPKVPRKEASS